jgi:hypothetical protein
MKNLDWWKHLYDYINGAQDTPPEGVNLSIHSILWGLWWSFLFVLILLFSGQSSKFIYIDF